MVLLAIGGAGAIHEEFFRPEASLPLLGFFLAILGIPASQGLQWLFRNTPGDSLPPSQHSDSLPSSLPSPRVED
jgi:hypothetical protein